MSSLSKSFEELQQRLGDGRVLSSRGEDPVYYLIFAPEEMLQVKRSMKEWAARLKLAGWEVHIFSMAETIRDLLHAHPLRPIWLSVEQAAPHDFPSINATLRDALTARHALKNRLLEKLNTLQDAERAVLLITDLEALHPYLRIGALEQQLQGQFTVPTVVLYPGHRSGEFSLSFLGIYPEDGNYRSIHIGG